MDKENFTVTVRKCLSRGLQDEEQILKMTLELGEEFLENIKQRTGITDSASIAALVESAVSKEIGRPDGDSQAGVDASLATMAQQLEALRQGQRTLFQLIDKAATILNRQVINVGPRVRKH